MTKKTKKKTAKKTNRPRSMRALITQMVQNKKSNAQVIAALKRHFPEWDDVAHAHYPVWYRADAVRRGIVTKAFAKKYA